MSRYPRLEVDRDGTVDLVTCDGPDDDAEFATLGHVASPATEDACPDELRRELAWLRAEFVRELEPGPFAGDYLAEVMGIR